MSRPDTHRPLPPVDERLVMPETGYEVIDGQVEYVSPSDPPHASAHSKLSALLEAHVAPGYDAASDMLTRTSALNDMAPDASVYPVAPDPETGGRQLEVLAFEVISTERLSHAGLKADRLTGRGVRRVFAIDVSRKRVVEWDRATGGWSLLPSDAVLTDPALAAPLPVRALVEAGEAHDAMARALLARDNPVLASALDARRMEGRAEGKAEGRAEGRAEALLLVLGARGLPISDAERGQILGTTDPTLLDRWLLSAATCPSVAALLGPVNR